MARTRRRLMRRDDGAQVVEFALIVPIVLVLIGAVFQFGLLLNAQVTVTQAAREGVRIAALHQLSATCNTTCVYQFVVPVVTNGAAGLKLDATQSTSNTQIQITPCAIGATQTTDATVKITYNYNLGAPLFKKTIHVIGRAKMPCGG